MAKRSPITREAAQALAVQALTYLAAEPERLVRFLDLAGLDPSSIRAAARDPRFLSGVLEHVAGDERLLLDFAESADVPPAEVDAAREALSGRWERDVP
ncbi:MAG TPA: DUF3572 domain-containing protein [Xanthobacteraceae bacterium]|nr:DUF3572 domain-containing protein [Xanthobacteraceae bacterium]